MKKSLRILGLVGVLFILALANPGSGIGLPTLVTITIDGNLADWKPVLSNPVNVTHDGDGSSFGAACIGSTDKDCEVKGGTGRDLLTFAWTYDSDNIYLLIERWGSSSNIIRFFFVMDLDADGYAQDTDRVLLVEWSGVKEFFDAMLCSYIPDPVGSGSDPLTDPAGYADGWTMPGSIDPSAPLHTYPQVYGGETPDGLRFEVAVPWTDLGLTGPTPIKFHVASNNNTNLNQAVDNMGGPNGGVGSFSFAGVDIYPPWVKTSGPGATVTFPHTIENVGNQDGRFDLTGRSALGLPISYYSDPDGDGVGNDLMALDANGDGDFDDPGDTPPPLAYDANDNGLLDFDIPIGGMAYFVAEVQTPPFLTDVVDFLRFHVRMDSMIFVEDQVEDQLYIGYFTVYPDRQASAVAGQYVDYGHGVTNNQSFDDTGDLTVLSSQGWTVQLYADTDVPPDGIPDGALLAEDVGGDGTWDTGDPDTGVLAAGGGTAWFVVRVLVPGSASVGDVDTTTFTATSVVNPNRSGTATDTTTVRTRVTVQPDYTFADGTNLYGSPGTPVYFPFEVVNSWITADSFSLGAVSAQGWTVNIWSDPNGNGSIDDGVIIANTGVVAGMGGTYNLVVEVRVPATASIGDQDTVTLTATSDLLDTESDSAIGQLEVHMLQTFRDPLYLFQAAKFATCETIYTRASGLEPGQATRYKLRYLDDGMTQLHEDDLVSNARGFADAYRAIADDEPLGNWTLQLWDTSDSSVLDYITVEHERSGTVGPVTVFPDPTASGNDMQIFAVYTNTNAAAPYGQTTARVWVRDPDGRVLLDDGTFVPDTGQVTHVSEIPPLNAGQFTADIFTITNITYQTIGWHTVEIVWEIGCGDDVIAWSASGINFWVDADTDGDGVADSVDICPYVYNPMQDLLADPLACGDCDTACDDTFACTSDTCSAGVCVNTPDDALCPDNGQFCDGAEYCDPATGCDHTGDPCLPASTCNEEFDICGCGSDDDCDDGVGCTDDSCDAGTCVYIPNNANCPDDGEYCNGAESCDQLLDCVHSGDPCPVDLMCNETGESCDECLANGDCSDGVGCTDDTCEGGSCVYTPNDDNCPDDGLYCTGDDVCHPTDGCLNTGNPCAAGLHCQESTDSCEECILDSHCTDGVPCTDNACVANSCVFTANDANCADDGQYCTGLERCDAATGCYSEGDPCAASGYYCNDTTDRCDECQVNAHCNDGIFCTVDSCVNGTCWNSPSNARCPDDGQYCNGSEYCSASSGCRHSGDPCAAIGLTCNETTDECEGCLVDADCDDGVGCTNDTCVNNSCVFTPDDLNCADDGLYCNGLEICSPLDDCVSAGDPCEASGRICNEDEDRCDECLTSQDCDDGLYCNGAETCVGGSCRPGSDPCFGQSCDEINDMCDACFTDADCDDGEYCNGAESCVGGVCQIGMDPCPGMICNEARNECMTCLVDADCEDSWFCNGSETCWDGFCRPGEFPCQGQLCDEGSQACVDCLVDDDCDDGFYCSGAETCQDGVCQTGPDPCPGQICDEPNDECKTCTQDSDCDDGLYCNGTETCVGGTCQVGADPCPGLVCDEDADECKTCTQDSDCDNGLFCDGLETCVGGFCSLGDNPCPPLMCDEDTDTCMTCLVDADCDDGLFCSGVEECVNGFCQAGTYPCPGQMCNEGSNRCGECLSAADCDDGLYCTGAEICLGGRCWSGADPCPGQICDETNNACAECLSDSHCDDGLFCTGAETCVDSVCQAGTDPCPGQICDEAHNECQVCTQDGDCDDGLYCNGAEICSGGTCDVGVDPCPGQICDEVNDECAACVDDADCDDGLWCNGAETCAGGTCWQGAEACPGQMCDEDDDACVDCLVNGDCDDGLYCNGNEVCQDGVCADGMDDPCPGLICDEILDECVSCAVDADCDDGVFCNGIETCDDGFCRLGGDPCPGLICDEGNQRCKMCTLDSECDDGLYCNGIETCYGGFCMLGSDPCPGRGCDEGTDECTGCADATHCDDGVDCTDDTCVDMACVFTPNDDNCADDGLYCNGEEICNVLNGCMSAGDPCAALGLTCNEDIDACEGCTTDADCDDGIWCNGTETCVGNACQAGTDPCPGQGCDEDGQVCTTCDEDADCDDGVYCNGAETCDTGVTGGACQAGTDPCPGQQCNEDDDACADCITDVDCDDGLYCNGSETCEGATCQAGDPPCPAAECNEAADTCAGCTTHSDCDDGLWCNGTETCVSGTCQAGTDPCPDGRCHEGLDKCEDWWEEKDIRGGGCQCGTSGASGAGLLLLLLGLAVLRLRPRV